MLPKRPEVRLAILQLLASGKEMQPREIMAILADTFKLTDEDRKKLIASGFETSFNKGVAFAISDLKREGLIHSPQRAIYVITDIGYDVLEHQPSVLKGKDFGNATDQYTRAPFNKKNVIDPSYFLGSSEQRKRILSNHEEFSSILKGRSIIEVNDLGEQSFQLGLSGDIRLNVNVGAGATLLKNIVASKNDIDTPSITMDLGDMKRRVPIAVMTTKLDALRTLYAIIFLLQNNRSTELESFLLAQPNGDVEQSLLDADERICIESISYGSFVAVLSSGAKAAYKALILLGGLVFVRYREAFIKKAETEVKLNEALVQKTDAETRQIDARIYNDNRKTAAEIDKTNAETRATILNNQEREFELRKKQLDYMIEFSQQMNNPEAREILRTRLISEVKRFMLGDNSDDDDLNGTPV